MQAKSALLGYALTYRDTHPGTGFGYLPCPDTDNSGSAQANCGNAGETMIGRLPYKTLGISDLRSADGECLWYIVSGSHKNNPKSAPLNWDTHGQIRVQDLNASLLADPDDSSGGAVAIIVAPGAPLPGQDRPSGTLPCSGDASNSITAYLDGNAGGAYAKATAGTLTVVAGKPRSQANNDRIAWISARELFAPLARRNDLLGNLLPQLMTCLNFSNDKSLPTPANGIAAGAKIVMAAAGIDEVIGVAKRNCTLDTASTAAWKNWKDHFRYVICSTPSNNCLQVNAANCSGAILFGGRSASGNPRSTTEKLALASYFDSTNESTLTTASNALIGTSVYSGKAAQSDIALCLQPAPAMLSFQNNFADLTAAAVNYSGKSMIETDAATKTLTLGSVGLTGDSTGVNPAQLFGCSWFGTTLPFGSGLRAYFRYEILNSGPGFIFALTDANPGRNPSTAMCGRGDSSLGYSGLPNDGNSIPNLNVAPIQHPKIGLEIDTRQNISRNDPNAYHIAIAYWGDPTVADDDNIHGAPLFPASGSPQNPAAVTRTISNDLNVKLHVRLEILRTPWTDGHNYAIKAWVLNYLPPDFDLLSSDFDESIEAAQIHTSANIADLSANEEALRDIRLGFTNAATSTSDQKISITNFAAKTQH